MIRLLLAAITCLILHAPLSAQEPARPNILWITAEDISPHLGSFGDVYAVTPHLDRLANQGVRYVNAFAPIGVCAPARSTLILGMYAPSVGSQHMRSAAALPNHIKLYSQYLREAGYYCTNNRKQDYNLATVPDDAWDESSGSAHWRNRPEPDQPFFAIFNFTTTHESQVRLSEEDYRERTRDFLPREFHDPGLAPIPPYHPDTAEVRRDWARYADMITFMDKQAAEILDQLEADGLADNTIVFFYSDHGAGMPRSKRWLYDSSIRVPLIIRFPERYQHLAPGPPGSFTRRLVSFVDFAPTLLSLTGVEIPSHMQGRAFLGELAAAPRRYVHGFRDRMDERYDMVRAVRDERYKYIRNFLPHKIYAQYLSYMYQMPTMRIWQNLSDQGLLIGPQKAFFRAKPSQELYDTWADPHEVHNLAERAEFRPIRDRLANELRRWILEIRDTSFLPEAEMHSRSEGSTPYEMARSAGAYRLERILEAAELASAPPAPGRADELLALLRESDSAVRYWAVNGLIGLGSEAEAAQRPLERALGDASPDVALSAAEALCRLGQCDKALPMLQETLGVESEWLRLRAAIVLDEFPEQARPLLPKLKEAFAANKTRNDRNYPNRVLDHLIERLSSKE